MVEKKYFVTSCSSSQTLFCDTERAVSAVLASSVLEFLGED